jgi:hypothetical protein
LVFDHNPTRVAVVVLRDFTGVQHSGNVKVFSDHMTRSLNTPFHFQPQLFFELSYDTSYDANIIRLWNSLDRTSSLSMSLSRLEMGDISDQRLPLPRLGMNSETCHQFR